MNDLTLMLPALLTFAAVAFGTLAMVFLWEGLRAAYTRRQLMKRLQPIQDDTEGRDHDLLHPGEIRAQLARHIPYYGNLGMRLRQAGSSLSPLSLVMLELGLGGAFGLFFWMVLGPLVAIPVGFLVAMIPELWLQQRQRGRARRFEEMFPEAIDLLGRAIRAGHPLSAGIKMVADEAADPVASEFRQVFEEQRFGLPFDDALLGLADRNDLMDVRIFVTAVMVQREVGGNLAEVLDRIAQTVRARFTIRRQLRVHTAQGRMSGYVLGVMPIAVGLGIFAFNREYARILIDEPLGRAMILGAMAMQVIGYLWIRRIVNIEI